ncbi:50S ribosomal protein L17 [Patescibacteria group bacterium]|nr:50S ribosomal protein L17 [Patescibacteria group bacterium]
MRHNKTTAKLSRNKEARKALLSNLAMQLIIYEAIVTTEAKAKELRKYVEPMITKARKGTLADRRMLIGTLPVKKAVSKLFDIIGPKYKTRDGGYTRIIKLEPRSGDGAKMAKIELV